MIEQIRDAIPDAGAAHLTCFNATALERTLACASASPCTRATPPSPTSARRAGAARSSAETGIRFPDGFEHLRDVRDVQEALAELKRRNPDLRRAVIKLNDGFSGEGNAVFDYAETSDETAGPDLLGWVRSVLPQRLRFEARGERWERYAATFAAMGGGLEAWVEGDEKRSPSAQCRVDPLGQPRVISTHDQVLGGPAGQIFLGACPERS